MGTTRAFFQVSGKRAELIDRLYIKMTLGMSISNADLIIELFILSRPEDLEGFILLTTLCTSIRYISEDTTTA